jgi:glycerate kinase
VVVVAVVDDALAGLDATLDGAGLAITGEGSFDWRSLRDTHVTAVARAAAARGVPCVVLAGQVLVGRREAAAVGVDAAYAITDGAGGEQPADPAEALAALAETVARRWSR